MSRTVSSFGWDDGFVLDVSIYVSQILDAYARKVCWYSTDGDDAICLYYQPNIGEFWCFIMVNWMILYEGYVFCPESEWTGSDGEWHNYQIQMVGNSIELSRDGVIDFTIDDDSLDYFSHDGYIQLLTLGTLCCFDDVSLVSVQQWQCGDADGTGEVDIDDAVHLVNYIFAGGPAPDPVDAGDANCSSDVDIDDISYLVLHIFSGGPGPCAGCQ